MTSASAFVFERQGRSLNTGLALAGAAVLCAALALVWQVTPWVWGTMLVFMLPAAWDLFAATKSGVSIDTENVTWRSGRHGGDVPLHQIDHVRFVTRLDFTVRAAIVLTSGRKLRIPAEATPPFDDFDAALKARDIRTERHHFTFL